MSLLRESAADAVQGSLRGGFFSFLTADKSQFYSPIMIKTISTKPPPYLSPALYVDVNVGGTLFKAPLYDLPCTGLYADSSWPSSRGTFGNLNEGRANASGPSSVGASWLCSFGGASNCEGSSAVVGADGTIYICSNTALRAVSPEGVLKWSYVPGGNTEYSFPAVGVDGTVFFQDSTSLFAITPPVPPATTPTLKWSTVIGNGNDAVPLIGCDGNIYTGTSLGLYSIHADTGAVNWFNPAFGNMNGWNKAIEGTVLFVNAAAFVYAVNTADGSIIWSTDAIQIGGLYSMPVVDRTGVYMGTQQGHSKLNKTTGAVLWSTTDGSNCNDTSGALFGNLIIYGSQNYLAAAFDIDTGATVWSVPGSNNATSASVDTAGRVYLAEPSTGNLVAIDAATGAVVWTDPGAATGSGVYGSVAITNNGIYTGTQDGLYCLLNA
jgi:outer membrane protein assembly factor BamB